MSMKLWDTEKMNTQTSRVQPVYTNARHTEFVFGVDFSLFQPGVIATCGWDETVQIIRT